jgi:hypothetical protein
VVELLDVRTCMANGDKEPDYERLRVSGLLWPIGHLDNLSPSDTSGLGFGMG